MATDNTEPRTGLIVKFGILTVVVLLTARFALVSYFESNEGREYREKVGTRKSEQLMELRGQEQQMLTSGGAMPIDKAMSLLAEKGRTASSPAVAPQQSEDMGAMTGWRERPRAAQPASAPAAGADGGAAAGAMSPDAGATSAAADAGTHASAATPDAGVAQGAGHQETAAQQGAGSKSAHSPKEPR